MTRLRTLRFAMVVTAGLGVAAPQCVLQAGEKPAAAKKAAPKVADVSLTENGALAGAVVSEAGKPVDGAIVTLTKEGKPVAKTTTNAQGKFALASVKSGSYELKAGHTTRLVRLWNSDVAPPASAEKATLVMDSTTVRAQDGYSDPYYEAGGLDFISLATVGVATAGLAVGIVNQADLNDIKDDIDKVGSP
ncbi:MAG TPA: carboxypeptidase-like regulatory domain-containing protein [Caulifigura sp.]|nr:carboxypeptidase-like regulatory domain-containing protein [Caulifigura sp.]